jgi:carbamoyl-phosphate synthase small subunit
MVALLLLISGQILVFTQPLIGNYGVPAMSKDRFGLFEHFESGKIQTKGIIVNDYAAKYSHWTAVESLGAWCKREGIPALTGVDTRALVSLLRNNGSTLGRISQNNQNVEYPNYSGVNMVEQVSSLKQQVFNKDGKLHVALLDCGAKQNIIRCLAKRNVKVTTFPWNYDVSKHLASFDGLFISNGPGDPQNCQQTITNIRKVYDLQRTSSNPVPIFGICMGHQLMGLAAGFEAYKLPFGNRGHNQPVNYILNLGFESNY